MDSSFALDNVQAQFLSGTKYDQPITYTISRLSTGKRFAVRLVTASQNDGQRNVLCVTLSFASHPAADNYPAMTHTIQRESPYTISQITLDDLEPGRGPEGPFMRFQRFPNYHPPTSNTSSEPQPIPSLIATTACHMYPPLPHPSTHPIHTLALLNLSDYHVLDSPLTLTGIPFGLPAINDTSRTPLLNKIKMFTSLNHSVYFHRHDRDVRGGFRADEMCYVEVRCPWAAEGRALVETRIFDRGGGLLASCVQEVSFLCCPFT